MPDARAVLWLETSRWLEAALGLHFSPRQWPDLERGLAAAAQRLGLPDAAACAERALAGTLSPEEQQVLAECLTVGETYFFRDPQVFAKLGEAVLAPLLALRRRSTRHLRLWSAGCSTGEEPYSLAMLVASLLPDWREWNISILATDINPAALRKARAGAYGRWSLRGVMPPQARPFLLEGADGRFHVHPELRRLVRFTRLNLAGADYPDAANTTTAMDLVLCRNVLIYFEPARVRAVLERLGRSLVEGGWLVTGSVEAPRLPIPGLAPAGDGAFAALRRCTAAGVPAPALPPDIPKKTAPSWPSGWGLPAPPVPARETAPAPEPGPVSAAGLAQEARASADAGDLARAEELCRRAVEQDKLNAEWPYLLATILLERGALDEADAALQRTLYLEPDHVLARFSRGTLALRAGRAQAGRRLLSHALARLAHCPADEIVQGSGGLTARELADVIRRVEGAAR